MANITFTSPSMNRDVTVHAVAGDTRTLLAVAKAHHIPLHHECKNGACGCCQAEGSVLSGKTPCGLALTEKEKTVLRFAGKITTAQIAAAETDDLPPP